MFGSQIIETSGLYQETFSNTLGCDSTVLLDAIVFDTPLSGIIQEGNTLVAEDNSDGLIFQWYDCSLDQKIDGEINREFIPAVDGTYSLEVSNGVCTVESICFDYIHESLLLNTEEEKIAVSVFPNPTTDRIRVTFPKGGRSNITIYGLDGKLIVEADVSEQTSFEYDLPEPGMYLLQIDSSSGLLEYIKVLRK